MTTNGFPSNEAIGIVRVGEANELDSIASENKQESAHPLEIMDNVDSGIPVLDAIAVKEAR